MSRYARHNPDERPVFDWYAGGTRVNRRRWKLQYTHHGVNHLRFSPVFTDEAGKMLHKEPLERLMIQLNINNYRLEDVPDTLLPHDLPHENSRG